MTDRELMQMALNCLTLFGEDIKSMTQEEHEAIVALRARLAQPEPEPVAWMFIKKDGMQVITDDPDYKDGTWTPLYTAPPQRDDTPAKEWMERERAVGYREGHQAALKQRNEPKPVAYTNKEQLAYLADEKYAAIPMAMWAASMYSATIPLYTAPPQRQFIGLTDEEIMDACAAVWASHPIEVGQVVQDLLKERNT